MSDAGLLAPTAWPWLLLVPAVVGLALLAVRRADRDARQALGERAAATGSARRMPGGAGTAVLLGVATLAVAIACLRPAWGDATEPVEQRGVDVVVCLDVSRSMAARDLGTDRATLARRELELLTGELDGDRLALVLFAGSARLAVPATRDLDAVLTVAREAGPHSVERGGTDLAAALQVAGDALVRAEPGRAAVFLVTDGEDHEGRARGVALELAERGIAVHTFGLGTTQGAKIPVTVDGEERFLVDEEGAEVVSGLDRDGLTALAAATGGAFRAAVDDASLVDLHRSHVRPLAAAVLDSELLRVRPERFRWALVIALCLGILELCRPPATR